MQSLVLWGPLDVIDPYIQYVVLVLALANLVTRQVAHRHHKRQADEGADAMSRHLGHEATNVLLVLASFYMILSAPTDVPFNSAGVTYHGGFVTALLVLGLVVTDFFEFEARLVEVRNDMPVEIPKAAIVASMLVVSYALFQAFWFLVEGYWQSVVS